MIEFINNTFGATSWGIIAVIINFSLCGLSAALAWVSLKVFPPKKK